ncbi:hypothetical protein TEQG_08779 [Trichophyton equinum CBS 127.97]|uniref:C2H2-type domain-containing protein n=1 Tax=Trichophyton equinum (strain ATCC MYA-4606 / CBS 127.97) TaxID=559882 RepID=F2Q270_TRIEC|nr:hypothetical protein TEQG_08779 [Trichophyton equinum CBS 127.97]
MDTRPYQRNYFSIVLQSQPEQQSNNQEERVVEPEQQLNGQEEGERAHCPFCPRNYASQEGLWNHTRKSHKDEIFYCPSCPKAYISQERLQTHIKAFHKEGARVYCSFCPRNYALQEGLWNHTRKYHKDEIFYCPSCPKTYISQERLQAHIKAFHKEGARVATSTPLKVVSTRPTESELPSASDRRAMATSFQVYHIPDGKSTISKILEADSALRNAKDSRIVRYSDGWFVASSTPPDTPNAHLIHDGLPRDKRQHILEGFLEAAADAANSENADAWSAYKRIAEQSGLTSDIEDRRYSRQNALQTFHGSRQQSLVKMMERIDNIFDHLRSRKCEEVVEEAWDLSTFSRKIYEEGEAWLNLQPRILLQAVNPIQDKITGYRGRIESIFYRLLKIKETGEKSNYYLLAAHGQLIEVRKDISLLSSSIPGETQHFNQPLRRGPKPLIVRSPVRIFYLLAYLLGYRY